MKQIIQSYKTGAMNLEEVPRPQAQPGTVLVETRVSVVSAGTEKMLVDLARKSLLGKARSRPDLVKKVIDTAKKEGFANTVRKVRSKLDTPIPLGYSCSGIVRALGDGVDEFRVGDRVACGGAGYANHAEFNVVPKNLCVRLPAIDGEPLTFGSAAFATIGAIALQGVRQAALTLGERICVIGLGLLGQITVQLCKANGCFVIGADIDDAKFDLARKLGADVAVSSTALESAVAAATDGRGADAVIITAAAHGSELIELAGDISRPKGRVVAVGMVGLDVPRDVFYKKELDLRLSMSYGPGRYDPEYEERGHDYPLPYVRWTEQRNMQAILDLVSTGRLDFDALVTHRFLFDQALGAYDLISGGREPYLGILLTYPEQAATTTGIIRLAEPEGGNAGKRIRLGVLGAGNFAKGVLLPRLATRDDLNLIGIATARGISARAVGEQFGFRYCTESADRIMNDENVNAVLIATRHNLHGALVLQALKTGKHVFVEKPLSIDRQEIRKIVDLLIAYSENQKIFTPPDSLLSQSTNFPVLMVGYNRRFSPFVRKAVELLPDGPVVSVYTVNAGRIPKDSWIQDPVEGGGRILGEVCHFVDTLRYLHAARVQTVQAAALQASDSTMVNRDSMAVTLGYDNGSMGTIIYQALGNAAYPKERLEIHGSGKTMVIDDYRRLMIFDRKKEIVKANQDKGFDAEIDAFATALQTGGPAPIPLAELIETSLVTFAIHESLNTGAIVSLDAYTQKLGLPLIR